MQQCEGMPIRKLGDVFGSSRTNLGYDVLLRPLNFAGTFGDCRESCNSTERSVAAGHEVHTLQREARADMKHMTEIADQASFQGRSHQKQTRQ